MSDRPEDWLTPVNPTRKQRLRGWWHQQKCQTLSEKYLKLERLENVTPMVSACLASVRPWVQSPFTLQKRKCLRTFYLL
jgi:hypothetical protein